MTAAKTAMVEPILWRIPGAFLVLTGLADSKIRPVRLPSGTPRVAKRLRSSRPPGQPLAQPGHVGGGEPVDAEPGVVQAVQVAARVGDVLVLERVVQRVGELEHPRQ